MTGTATRLRPRTPQAVFDRAAPYYDRFNSMLSLGSDRRWRRAAARAVDPAVRPRVLDVATGTASVALAVLRRARRQGVAAEVVGVDLNASMLAVARKRVSGAVRLVRAGADRLPFPDASFDAVTIAFAIDDVADRDRCAAELIRVLRPGGRVVLLELGLPPGRVMRQLYAGVLGLMGLLGRSRGAGAGGYRHLRAEILGYRGADAVRDLLERTGFTGYRRELLTRGIAVLHVADRGEAPDAG